MKKVPPRFLAERIGLFVAVACAVVYLVLKQFSILNNLDAEIGMLLFMVFVLVGDAILASWRRNDDEKAIIQNWGVFGPP
jgi:asparagine N-glycosylation enzyme membrane subunit Stt3